MHTSAIQCARVISAHSVIESYDAICSPVILNFNGVRIPGLYLNWIPHMTHITCLYNLITHEEMCINESGAPIERPLECNAILCGLPCTMIPEIERIYQLATPPLWVVSRHVIISEWKHVQQTQIAYDDNRVQWTFLWNWLPIMKNVICLVNLATQQCVFVGEDLMPMPAPVIDPLKGDHTRLFTHAIEIAQMQLRQFNEISQIMDKMRITQEKARKHRFKNRRSRMNNDVRVRLKDLTALHK